MYPNDFSLAYLTGLISSAVVSSWTWPTTLLTSSTFAYEWGVSGSLWYGIGGSVQIFLFTILALEIKRRVNCLPGPLTAANQQGPSSSYRG